MPTYITTSDGRVVDLEADVAKKSDLTPLQQAAQTANTAIAESNAAHQALADAAAVAKAEADAATAKAADGVTRTDMAQSNLPSQPRLRIEKNTTLALSTSWQRIDFSSSNPINVNTFPMMADNATPAVRWDTLNKLMMFGATEDRNYVLDLDLAVTNSSILTTLLGNTMVKIQYRFVVPNGRGSGLAYTFPFPGTDGADGYGEVGMTTSLLSSQRISISRNIYASQIIRTNGIGVDLRLSTAPALGAISLTVATLLCYGR